MSAVFPTSDATITNPTSMSAQTRPPAAHTYTPENVCPCPLSIALLQVEPGVFRDLHTFMQKQTGGKGRIEVLTMAVMADATSAGAFAAARPTAQSGFTIAAAPALPPPPAQASTTEAEERASAARYV